MLDKKKKKIAYISIRADLGGGPFHVNQLIENFIAEYEIFCAAPLDLPFGVKWLNQLGDEHFLRLDHRNFSIKKLFGLIKFIRQNNITLIHSHGKGAGIYSRLLKFISPKLKIIHTFHGFHPNTGKISDTINIIFERVFGLLTDKYINVSNGEHNLCKQYKIVTDSNSKVIFNGINEVNLSIHDKNKLRTKLNLDQNKFIVTSVNRFDPQKNVSQILDIAKKLVDEKSILFLLVGDGEEKDILMHKAKQLELSNVQFAGFKKNALEFISVSDVYLTTSLGEALPYTLIEAQMSGTLVIASNVIGNNEIIRNGENGYLFDLNNNEKVALLIKDIFSNKGEYKHLAENGTKNYKNNFTLSAMISNIKNIYEKTLN